MVAILFAAYVFAAWASGAGAGPPPPPTPSPAATTVSELVVLARRATTVSGVDVVARRRCVLPRPHGAPDPRPRVVDSYPRFGQTVPPGVFIMHVTYDQPMSRCPLFVSNAGGGVARLDRKLAWLTPDYRTIFFVVDVQPAENYRLWLNVPSAFGWGFNRTFLSRYGTPAAPHMMVFSTSRGPPTVTVKDVPQADPSLAALLDSAKTIPPPPAP